MSSPASPPLKPDTSLEAIVARVRKALAEPLPGLPAQRLMAPVPRTGWRPAALPEDARRAAGLVLLYPWNNEAHLALTLRTAHLPNHGGQVSLPGGAVEPDETIEATAVREAVEEVGIDPAVLQIVGHLTPLHIPISGFVLHPVIGVADRRPSFVPSAHEVARVIDVPLAILCDPLTVRLRQRIHEGRHYEIPYFMLDGEIVWGATAMVLSEFLALVGHAPFRSVPEIDGDTSF
jgi:8-oxo-dGTP pyrophosphatase MutT (NUDIX family)